MPKHKDNEKKINPWLKYSTLSFQLVIIVLLGVSGGYKLDGYFGFETPVCTAVCSFIAIIIAIYYLLKDSSKKK